MKGPKQRLVLLGNALAFASGLALFGLSSFLYISEQTNDWFLPASLGASLILLTSILLSILASIRTPIPRSQPAIWIEHGTDVLNAIEHGVVVIDHHYVISYANHAFCQWVTSDANQLIGKSISDVFLQVHATGQTSISYRMACLALASGTGQSTFLDLPLENNRFRHMHITATPITNQAGRPIAVLLLYQDRTAERELQDTIRRHDQLDTVSQMAASIAHEVRNPMTSVQGFLQLMRREIDSSHAHSMYLHVMEEDLKRINSIITEYLNFSRMGSDSLEDVWIGTLLHNTYTLLQSEANLKGIDLVLSLLGNNPLLIANPNRLKQVVINLCRNAMEAMSEQGGGVLTLSLETSDDHICLMIKDTGPGIPLHLLEQIFQPFYTTKPTGTGLGLFISKQIIEEHNGTIEVETKTKVGTTFLIRLPKNRLSENQ